MRKFIYAAALTALAFGANAEVQKLTAEQLKLLDTPVKQLTPEQREQRDVAFKLQELIQNGGAMPYPGTPKGTIRYVNLQKRVPAEDLKKALRVFGSLLAYDVKIVDADCEATLKVKIIDDAAAPTLLVAPEERWAQVNVSRLAVDKPEPAFLAARTRKEMIRAFSCLTCGSSNDAGLFRPYKSVKDLDKVVERGYPIDIIMRSKKYLQYVGLEPLEMTNYRTLLQCGFKISPTNDYQKAIFEDEQKKSGKTSAK